LSGQLAFIIVALVQAVLPDGVYQTKNSNLGKFWKVLQWKMLVFFVAILSISRPNGVFNGHLVHFVVIWNIFPVLVCCT
jgi:hypothetical protein